ncbi:MAG: hypothetical protein AAGA89_12685 [Pseudomonadota bacterium]
MNKTEWPEVPTLYVGDDEYALSDDVKIEKWSSLMSEKLRNLAENLGWKYCIGDTALSRSKKFKFIYRAKVHWETDEGDYDSIELIWSDYSGLSGSGGGPVSELSNEGLKQRPFKISGSTVVFPEAANPDWFDAPSQHANDDD